MTTDGPTLTAPGPTLERLEDQIGWYDRKAAHNQRSYCYLKVVQIVAAAVIPVLAGLDARAWVAGSLGALIVVLEGLQQLFQFQQNWISYRATCEALKHEKFLFLAHAGPYATAERPEALLAERIEGTSPKNTPNGPQNKSKAPDDQPRRRRTAITLNSSTRQAPCCLSSRRAIRSAPARRRPDAVTRSEPYRHLSAGGGAHFDAHLPSRVRESRLGARTDRPAAALEGRRHLTRDLGASRCLAKAETSRTRAGGEVVP